MIRYNEGYRPVARLAEPVFFRSWTPASPRGRVLCMHGVRASSADYERLAVALAEASYAVWAFDAPGSGFSVTRQEDLRARAEYGMRAMQAIFEDLAGPRAIVCGSGSAIPVLMWAYARRQDPVLSAVPLVFAEPAFAFSEADRRFLQACGEFLDRRYASLDEALDHWDRSPLGAVAFDDEEAKRAYVLGKLLRRGTQLVPVSPEPGSAARTGLRDFDMLANRAPLPNPALVLWGGKAWGVARHADRIPEVFPNGRSVTFEDGAHPLSLTRRCEIDAVRGFLDEALAD